MQLDGPEELKRQAAAKALEYVQSGMALGLGTGSTVAHFLDLLGEALASGALSGIVGVPTSIRTLERAAELRIPLTTLTLHPRLDLCIDGADEVSRDLDLIKGLGGALLREKMVAQASDSLLIMADDRKLVTRLGTVSPLPVEVLEWEHCAHVSFLEGLGAEVAIRVSDDGGPYRTDNGNVVMDCRFADGITDSNGLAAALKARAGVVEHGLFLRMAERAVVAGDGGVNVMERSS